MRSRLLLLVAAGLTICAGLIGTWAAPAASAHSRLIASDPADGAELAQGPARVTLTFNEPVQSTYAVLTVVGPDDHFWQSGEPIVRGDEISVGLRELGPAGEYRINYRVTSADGHVVSGQRAFELTMAGSGEPGPPVEGAEESTSDGGTPVWYFIIGAAVILVVGLGIVFWLARRPGKR